MPPSAKARFHCSHPGCQYAFSKADHLARHERTHSGLKPFACSVCQRRFARNDSLIRHRRLNAACGTVEQGWLPNDDSPGNDGITTDATPALLDSVTAEGLFNVEAGPSLTDPTPSTVMSDMRFTGSIESPMPDLFPSVAFYGPNVVWEDMLKSFQDDPLLAEFMQEPHALQLPQRSDSSDNNGADAQTTSDDPNQEDVIRDALSALKASIRSLPSRLITQDQAGNGPSSPSRLQLSLDHCLAHLPKVLPVIHEPTFDIRDAAPSALLLMLALGAAFTDSSTAASQGHSLWTLAHAVTITSWSNMLAQRGPYDACPGVQLVLTATLGQTFAMLSQSSKLRTTAQVVHALGFHWARQCGMYDQHYRNTVPREHQSPVPDVLARWKSWGARELQLRSLLAHYVLDGQIAQFFNTSTAVRHCINSLPLPADDHVFLASDVETWQQEMDESGSSNAVSFREYILALYTPSSPAKISGIIPTFAIRVILESFQSSICETIEAGGEALGLPSRHEITSAMVRLYHGHIIGSPDEDELALRWHAILGFSLISNIHDVCHQLCRMYSVQQTVFPEKRAADQDISSLNIGAWVQSREGRTTLLHAFAVCDRLKGLPLGRTGAMHLPFATFSAALVLLAYLNYETLCSIATVLSIALGLIENFNSS
ncbi:hypothetical protein PRZ48_009278 [Zasmidium cellare]|uniref:C2H2-type domain-containing protein n=1 Tax=Zasmidium cellare TaxID=395010 RepID=A0ABR0EC33_ZASCE|nr:hypothetical protein PRZ48_009278 [Zasmidium cellare]